LYCEQEKSSSIKIEEINGKLNFNYINFENLGIKIKRKIIQLLKDEGIKIVSGIINLGVGSSQHFSSILADHNKESDIALQLSVYKNDNPVQRVHFVDSSVFPKTPLCTIGLHSVASAYSITYQSLKYF
jgi:hypothetical protein